MKDEDICGFLAPLRLEAHSANTWKLTHELIYLSKDSRLHRVPVGFKTDLASIPRLARVLIPINGKHRSAAVLHDFFYELKGKVKGRVVSRAEADNLFLEAMESEGVSYWKRYTMYWAVRAAFWRTSWD